MRKPSLAGVLTHQGLVHSRNSEGDGQLVVGDPCIAWDADADCWRMILFFQFPGHGQSTCSELIPSVDGWSAPTRLEFTNPQEFAGDGTHKPFLAMDAHKPNMPAFVDGYYWLYSVDQTGDGGSKQIHRAKATTLAGPWTLDQSIAVPFGEAGAFDELHTDVVSAFYFEEKGEFVIYYMGYPKEPRHDLREGNPFGSSIGVAVQRADEPTARKLGRVLDPADDPMHWASGYLGGMQILPGIDHRWVGILNASPTPPSHDGSLTSEEPAPCLGGLAYCDEEYPVSGWTLAEGPLEWIDEIPVEARELGEGTNFWRHYALVLGDDVQIYYNSGFYGQEQTYMRTAKARDLGFAPSELPNRQTP